MTIANGEVLKAVVTSNLPDLVDAQNVFYWLVTTTGIDITEAVALSAIASVVQAMWAELVEVVNENVTLDSIPVHVIEYDETEGEWITNRYIGETVAAFTPTALADLAPHAVAPYLSVATDIVKVIAKKKLAGFVETNFTASTLTSGCEDAIEAFGDEWLTTLNVGTGQSLVPVTASTKTGNAEELIAYQVSDITGTQRTRKPGVGI
jgi:hypothetical protein